MIHRALFVLIFLACYCIGFSQITPNFSADTLSFCPPYFVQFTDQSTGSGIIYRKWTFGPNNFSVGNNKNPTASYVTSGNFDVTLTISNGIDTVSLTKPAYIHAFQLPKPIITSASILQGCPPLGVQLNEQSINGSAPINAYLWTFGDNSAPSTQQNPFHNYTQSGSFNVSLRVTDTNGCQNATDSLNMIEVFSIPNISFTTVNAPHHCNTPLTVNFINSTTGGANNTYWWSFGNGQTSTQTNPSVTYHNSGSYNVTLVATNSQGCSDTLHKNNFASAMSTQAAFSLPSDTVCVGSTFQVINQSLGASQHEWDFGDGSPIKFGFNPQHSYSNTGIYTIQLIGYSSATCRDTITKTVVVTDYQAMFTANKTIGCEIPFNVQFTPPANLLQDSSLTFFWKFGPQGATSHQKSPTFTYTSFGKFTVELQVESPYGCKSIVTYDSLIRVSGIEPAIEAPNREGCAPLNVQLKDVSSPQDSVVYRYWDFGDTAFYGPQNLSKIYTQPGVFFVFLTVGTKDSCEFSTSIPIEVGTKQQAMFAIDTNWACASDSLVVFNQSSDTSLINEYSWAFGDGQTSNIFEPKIIYTDTGWMDISLIVSFNGCADTFSIQNARQIKGPVANFNYLVDCKNPYDIQFNATIKGADSIFWDYGYALERDTNIVSPKHLFPATSDYLVKLFTKNNSSGCIYSFENTVLVRDLLASFSHKDTFGCDPFEVTFDARSSIDVFPGSFQWFISGDPIKASGPMLNAKILQKGKHPIQLIVSDENNCKDTANSWIKVFSPTPDFSVDTNKGCVVFSPQFTDLTQSDTTIVSWLWDFGNFNTSALQHPSASYNPPQTKKFDVKLTIENALGCTRTITKQEIVQAIRPPFLFFTDPLLCTKETAIFENLNHFSTNQYYWDFGNGDTSHQHPAGTQYLQGGAYSVLGVVIDTNGCTDTIIRINYIRVQDKPVANFIATPTDTSCYPAIVQFTDSTNHPNMAFNIWNFGDGSTPVNTTSSVVFNNYNRPGKYDVSLFVETTYGCKDTLLMQEYITIKGPFAKLNLPDDTVCTGQNVLFQLDSALGIYQTRWDFGDGNDLTVFGNTDTAKHIYQFDGKLVYRAFMIDTALKCPKYLEDTIFIHHTEAEFIIDKLQGCVPLDIKVNETGVGADIFQWNFSGFKKVTDSASYEFKQAGDFWVKLVATDQLTQCADSITKQVVVFPLPDVRTSKQHFICKGDSAQIFALGGQQYQWFPTDGLSEPNQDTLFAKPEKTSVYTVLVTDVRNCKNQGEVEVVVQDIPVFTVAKDTSLYAGQFFDLWVSSSDSLAVLYTPATNLFCPTCLTTQGKATTSIKYNVRIVDYLGCYSIDTAITVNVINEKYLFVPNAFSPNGDGLNDQFDMIITGYKRLVNMQIFDRWGSLVFETNDLNRRWDGRINGEVVSNSNVFQYVIILETFLGENVTKKGLVTIIK